MDQRNANRVKCRDDELARLSKEVVELLQKTTASKKSDTDHSSSASQHAKEDGRKQTNPSMRKRDKKASSKKNQETGRNFEFEQQPMVNESNKKVDKEGNVYYDITDQRRVTVMKFRGKPRVDIREFYFANDQLLPGKKGLSMSLEEYQTLKSLIPAIDSELARLQSKSQQK